jgi:hypothetical protein
MFETAGGIAAKLTNTHLMGGERVKELDFFVASIETPTVVVRPPDPAEAVTQLALRTQIHAFAQGEGVDLFVQKELLEGGGVPPHIAAVGAALRLIVHTCCGPKLLALPPSTLSKVQKLHQNAVEGISRERSWCAVVV